VGVRYTDWRVEIVAGAMMRGEANAEFMGTLDCIVERIIGAGSSTDQVSTGGVVVDCNRNVICRGCTSPDVMEVGVAEAGIVERIRRKCGHHRKEVLCRGVQGRDDAARAHDGCGENEGG